MRIEIIDMKGYLVHYVIRYITKEKVKIIRVTAFSWTCFNGIMISRTTNGQNTHTYSISFKTGNHYYNRLNKPWYTKLTFG